MKPPKGIETPTPPAFTDAQRRVDLSLRGADTNPLFEAFLRRRKLHRLRYLNRFPPAGQGSLDGYGTDRLKIILFFLIMTILTCGIAYPIFIICIISMNVRGRIATTRLPSLLMYTFSMKGYAQEAATDLVQAGARGRDVVECIYLEMREMQYSLGLGKAGHAIGCAVVAGYYSWHVWPFTPGSAFVLVAMAFAAWRGYYVMMDARIATIARMALLPRIIHWSSETPYKATLAYARAITPRMTAFTIWFVLPIIAFTFLGAGGMIMVMRGTRGIVQISNNLGEHLFTLAGIALILFVILSFFGREKRRAKGYALLEFYLSLSDDAFDNFVLTRILDDPDAKKLAEERRLGARVLEQIRGKRRWRWRFWKKN